jgi:hypothetical protein
MFPHRAQRYAASSVAGVSAMSFTQKAGFPTRILTLMLDREYMLLPIFIRLESRSELCPLEVAE